MLPEKDSVEIVMEAGVRVYRATIFAPDPCFKVPDVAEISSDQSAITVVRQLIRAPGLCAAVMTPVTVEGPVPEADAGETRFILVLRSEQGREVFRAEAALK